MINAYISDRNINNKDHLQDLCLEVRIILKLDIEIYV